ncbi:MauE/DoxX family redox-associated membrane protein [Mariniblastus fucicola]|uniref:Methylamine utilisation protein MauE domain-containing protein n=1 Tax=Mariniblastus fucicola TaxID=980251 RepID=A0A5B9PIC9_9BACT|nr:MauE/DoxX family redox-associated membrane protein [Mariniblastus fucicola]QEG24426.1 hypothetical protein MFFC18_43450 [Mariniblastus fucicola]
MNEVPISELPPKPWTIRYVLLLLSASAQLITLIITWPLWNVRTEVPHLPVFDLGIPQLPFAWVLVGSLAIVPFRPKLGVWLHFALMLTACLFDQMRAQPQFLAIWILMFATLKHSSQNYARWFLSSLWIWAGLHKALSPEWNTFRAFKMTRNIGLDAEEWYVTVAIAVAVTEIIVGLLAWWKPKWGAIGCVMLHVGIVIYLSPLFMNWNFSVIPWNLATAVVGCWILWTCDFKPTGRHRWAFGAFMIAPTLFFVGWWDHGYAHVLYSGMMPQGLATRNDGSLEKTVGWGALAVPFPKERRTLRQRFEADSEVGEVLHIFDPRPALPDLHFKKLATGVEQISRDEFFAGTESVPGVELDSERHIFLLALAGAKMRKREKGAMITGIIFEAPYFKSEQLQHLRFLPNLEEVQLSNTSVGDADMKWLVDLPKLEAIGLNQTAISDRGVDILCESDTLEEIQVDDTNVSDEAMQRFLDSR